MTESVIAIIAWLGGAFFCGLLPLGIAAVLFFSSRKRGQVGSAVGSAIKTTTAALAPGTGLVRLQGRIASQPNAIDGSAENALVYLRLKVERYERDEDSSGWRGVADKERGMPFQLDDGYGAVWVTPDGLDKTLLGEGIAADENQAQAAAILLGISPRSLRGETRFTLWELRAGQTVSVVGTPVQGQGGLLVMHTPGQPFIISPLLGQDVEVRISTQAKKTQIWMLVLGIPGTLMLLCGLVGALVSLIRVIAAK
jgi:hypothetical protein